MKQLYWQVSYHRNMWKYGERTRETSAVTYGGANLGCYFDGLSVHSIWLNGRYDDNVFFAVRIYE